jgi:hypothetical protein
MTIKKERERYLKAEASKLNKEDRELGEFYPLA